MSDSSQIPTQLLSVVRRKIVQWFDRHGRSFPWRITANPYYILIAEMLLRRTTSSAVLRVYPHFIRQFPTCESLASASKRVISVHMSTLGLQKQRTAHLIGMAEQLISHHSGVVPSDYDSLLALSGVGKYTANAVLNFAFGQPLPLVDGNILHLVSRLFGLTYAGSADIEAWKFMERFGDLQQDPKLYWGIIDLVAGICLRRIPRCTECPLTKECNWFGNKTH